MDDSKSDPAVLSKGNATAAENQQAANVHLPVIARGWKYAVGFILLAVLLAGIVRTVPFHLLTPDSGEYLIGARSLATGEGYRDLSAPGRPLLTWRPPGMSVLLIPAAFASPDCTIPAKLIVLLCGLGLLLVVYSIARQNLSPGWSLLILCLVATSPQLLVYSTEVLSEVPFTVAWLGLTWLAADWEAGKRGAGRIAVIGGLLCALPFLRSVGLPVVAVWFLWAMTARHRRPLLFSAVPAVATLIGWGIYQRYVGSSTYDGLMTKLIESHGPLQFAVWGVVNFMTYIRELHQQLFPGVLTTSYVSIVMDQSASMPLGVATNKFVTLGGTIALFGAAAGLVFSHSTTRWLMLANLVGYLAAVSLYPLRSERLIWPLVPFVWLLAVEGMATLVHRLAARQEVDATVSKPSFAFYAGGCMVLISGMLAVSQLRDWPAVLRPAWSYQRDVQQFFARGNYPHYYSDWQSSARFIRDHGRENDVVMVLEKEFFTISGKTELCLMPGHSAQQLRNAIAEAGVRWLVVNNGYPIAALRRLWFNPIYKFSERFHGPDTHMVFEIEPNRDGFISERAFESSEATSNPDDDASFGERAIAAWNAKDYLKCSQILKSVPRDARDLSLQMLLARSEAEQGFFEYARIHLNLMRLTQANEVFAAEILAGHRELEFIEKRNDPKASNAERIAASCGLIELHLEWGRVKEAWDEVASAKRRHPDAPEILDWEGRFWDWAGRDDLAETAWSAAVKRGSALSRDRLLTRRYAVALSLVGKQVESASTHTDDFHPGTPESYLELASRWQKEDLTGRALAVLETAAERYPRSREIADRLVECRHFYRLP